MNARDTFLNQFRGQTIGSVTDESTYSKRLENFINDNIKDVYDESHFVKTELRDTLVV